MTKPIHEILTDPDSLASLSDAQLKELLAPYILLSRTPILPEEKAPKKLGAEFQALAEALKNPALQATMAKAKELRAQYGNKPR